MEACESQCREIGDVGHPHRGNQANKFLNHSASSPTKSNVMNFDSIVDRAMQVFLEDFPNIAAPQIGNTYPLVELT